MQRLLAQTVSFENHDFRQNKRAIIDTGDQYKANFIVPLQ